MLTASNNDIDEIERLINLDKTVPCATRSIEDELTETQIHISLDPDDGPLPPGGVFDLFLVPPKMEETDPATAVNWPRAPP